LRGRRRLLAVRRRLEHPIARHVGARLDPLEDGGPFAYGGFTSREEAPERR
jgi:hypothetical protein